MKLTNNINTSCHKGTVTRGKISMNPKEFKDVCVYLKKQHLIAINKCITYQRDSLHNGVDGIDRVSKKTFLITICATILIVIKYNLKNYKNHNYLITITK